MEKSCETCRHYLKSTEEEPCATCGNSRVCWEAEPGKALGKPSALATQVGGSHYKDLKIQPVEYIHANNIPFVEGCVIKYLTRWRSKDGVKDLEKAKQFIDILIELEGRA